MLGFAAVSAARATPTNVSSPSAAAAIVQRRQPLLGSKFICRLRPSPLLGDVQSERPALEAILGKVFVEAMHGERGSPRHVRESDLAADGVDLVASAARGATP